jgi:hypothetical protein
MIQYMNGYKQTVPEVIYQKNFAKNKHIVAGFLNCFKGCYRSKHMIIILGSGYVKSKKRQSRCLELYPGLRKAVYRNM